MGTKWVVKGKTRFSIWIQTWSTLHGRVLETLKMKRTGSRMVLGCFILEMWYKIIISYPNISLYDYIPFYPIVIIFHLTPGRVMLSRPRGCPTRYHERSKFRSPATAAGTMLCSLKLRDDRRNWNWRYRENSSWIMFFEIEVGTSWRIWWVSWKVVGICHVWRRRKNCFVGDETTCALNGITWHNFRGRKMLC